MKVITFSRSKFEKLKPLKLSHVNTEGDIFEFNQNGNSKILKKLFYTQGPIFANKLYTLEMLDSHKEYLPDSFYIPDSLVSIDKTISGFTIPKVNGENLQDVLKDTSISHKEHIYYLRKIGEILDQMHNIRKYTDLKDLYLNDLHECNFMVNQNNRHVYVIDLDSCKICSNGIFPSKYLTDKAIIKDVPHKYHLSTDEKFNGCTVINENTDLYCYNIMILNYLYGADTSRFSIQEFYEYLNYLEYIGVNKELLSKFNCIVDDGPNKNPANYLSSLTLEQVCRSKSLVFNTVNNKLKSKRNI